ncbi:lipoprotein-releasing system permease protein [Catalinimonas alkaloidigena]|uniref:Lipoprotein-releasing system permease protein n=1 Tax=Catalinimonas alkaloidigena TaxID=1075417 RepID=A0A1G9SAS7_9BACT|nr:ABC transporter permease [Catalinimonas alkaloidigena]SDM32450.1 lipoprotein-releasing system permease protein [Catalinimonas alkaloidigena]
MKTLFLIARTHLLSRLKQTIVAVLGVTFGIGTFIFLISITTGSNDFFVDVTLNNSPHIHIYNDIQTDRASVLDLAQEGEAYANVVRHQRPRQTKPNLKDGMRIVELLRQDPRVYDVAPQVSSQVFFQYGPVNINGTITGVEVEAENRLFDLGEKIVAGDMNALPAAYNGVIMGSGLAKKLNVGVGDRVNITTPRGSTLLLTVVALFRTGLIDLDNQQSYATLATVQKILEEPNSYITDIKLKLNEMDRARTIATEYAQQFGYTAKDWQTANAALEANLRVNNIIIYGVVVAILFVAGFGIFNILTMMIYEKMKDIAILKAMGFSGGDIRRIFLIEAVSIGIVGALFGLVFGFVSSYAMSLVPFENDIMVQMDHLPVNFKLSFYISGLVFGLLTTTIAGYSPSRRAARIDPVEIIRG